MDYALWFSERLSQLRMEKGVSARDMSLSLGQCESYINKIENKHTLPSMTGFFYICEYLGIEPKDFFDTMKVSPTKSTKIMSILGKLSPTESEHILQIINDLIEK